MKKEKRKVNVRKQRKNRGKTAKLNKGDGERKKIDGKYKNG